MLTDELWAELCRPLEPHEFQVEAKQGETILEVMRFKKRPTADERRKIAAWLLEKYGFSFVGSLHGNSEIWTVLE